MVDDLFTKLRALFYVFLSHHVREVRLSFALDTAVKPGLVHHDEHRFHSVELSTNEPAFTFSFLTELKLAGCGSMDSHFVLDLRTDHIV